MEPTGYCCQLSCRTQDIPEGIKSFFEKRNPRWEGR
jgi:hypothetical protein